MHLYSGKRRKNVLSLPPSLSRAQILYLGPPDLFTECLSVVRVTWVVWLFNTISDFCLPDASHTLTSSNNRKPLQTAPSLLRGECKVSLVENHCCRAPRRIEKWDTRPCDSQHSLDTPLNAGNTFSLSPSNISSLVAPL